MCLGGVNSFLIIAVNVFVIITGYFSIRFSAKKFLTILVELMIYTILLKTIPYSIQGNYKLAAFSILNNNYWFVVEYLILMMFAPMLNSYLERITKKEYIVFLSGLLFVSCYLGFIWKGPDNMSGYELFQFVMLYAFGRYISIFHVRLKKPTALWLYIGLSLMTGLLYGFFYVKGSNSFAYRMTNYNSPLIIAASLSFFLLFLNFSFSWPIINQLSKSTLSIYLISGSFLGPYYYKFVTNQFLSYGNIGAIYALILGLVVFFLIAFIVDPLQRIINKFLVDKMLHLSYKT